MQTTHDNDSSQEDIGIGISTWSKYHSIALSTEHSDASLEELLVNNMQPSTFPRKVSKSSSEIQLHIYTNLYRIAYLFR